MKKSVTDLKILFDQDPIFAGQFLGGKIQFYLKEEAVIKNITISFEGHSRTGWSGDGTLGSGTEQWYFRVDIPALAYLIQAATQQNNKKCKTGRLKLQSGQHHIPFQFPIPPHAPNTFTGQFGCVEYKCKAAVVNSRGSAVKEERNIQVLGVEDLNWHTYAAIPFSHHQGYNTRFCCVKLADVAAVLQIPRTGYVSGETIEITMEVQNNHKKRKVQSFSIQLVQTVSFKVRNKTRRIVNKVHEQEYGEITPGSFKKLEADSFVIPKLLPPSFLRGCDSIDIQYHLLVSVQPGIEFIVPIIIGTIRFRDNIIKPLMQPLPWKLPEKMTEKENLGRKRENGGNERGRRHQNHYTNSSPFFPHFPRQPPPFMAGGIPHGLRPPPPPSQFGATRPPHMAGRPPFPPRMPPPPPPHIFGNFNPGNHRTNRPIYEPVDTDNEQSSRSTSRKNIQSDHVLKIEEIE